MYLLGKEGGVRNVTVRVGCHKLLFSLMYLCMYVFIYLFIYITSSYVGLQHVIQFEIKFIVP